MSIKFTPQKIFLTKAKAHFQQVRTKRALPQFDKEHLYKPKTNIILIIKD